MNALHVVLHCLMLFSLLPGVYPAEARAGVRDERQAVEVRRPAEEQLQAFREHPAFQYDRDVQRPDTWWDHVRMWFWQQLRSIFFGRSAGLVWQLLPYLVLAVALALVLLKLLDVSPRSVFSGAPAAQAVAFQEVGENVHAIDFDRAIEQAAQEGRHREAVRLLYLQALKRLADAGLIEWRAEKTNHDYLRELTDEGLRQPFEEATDLFEYIWYGDFPVNEPVFTRARAACRALTERLPQAV